MKNLEFHLFSHVYHNKSSIVFIIVVLYHVHLLICYLLAPN